MYDEDGTLHHDDSYNPTVIPEDIHEHSDSVFMNFDLEDGILAFIYESGYKVIIVYTSQEAEDLCSIVFKCTKLI